MLQPSGAQGGKHDNMKVLRAVSLTILAVGALLAAFMIYTESEPGALPLALLLVGGIGCAVCWAKSRKL